MDTNPALHPHHPEDFPDMAPSPRKDKAGEGVAKIGVAKTGISGVGQSTVMIVEPCTGAFDPAERRAYAGVMASKLADLAEKLVACRLVYGIGTYFHAFISLTEKLQHALYIYTRVKDAMAALYAPEDIDLPVNHAGDYLVPDVRAATPKITWEFSPREAYAGVDIYYNDGRDLRPTSLTWVEHRARLIKTRARQAARKAYINDHNIQAAKARPVKENTGQFAKTDLDTKPVRKICTPMPLVIGEIWPPVPLPSKIDTQITVTAVLYPRPPKDIVAMGRKIGFDHLYGPYYDDPDNITYMWTGEAGTLRFGQNQQRGPP